MDDPSTIRSEQIIRPEMAHLVRTVKDIGLQLYTVFLNNRITSLQEALTKLYYRVSVLRVLKL